jgi:hypothetical protein
MNRTQLINKGPRALERYNKVMRAKRAPALIERLHAEAPSDNQGKSRRHKGRRVFAAINLGGSAAESR